MSKLSPAELTLREWRKETPYVDITERWVIIPKHPAGGKRKDLFGFIDVVAVQGGTIYGIQTTTRSNISARRKKIEETNDKNGIALMDKLKAWVSVPGARFVIEGWYKKPNGRWDVKRIEYDEITGEWT